MNTTPIPFVLTIIHNKIWGQQAGTAFRTRIHFWTGVGFVDDSMNGVAREEYACHLQVEKPNDDLIPEMDPEIASSPMTMVVRCR